MKLRKDVLRFPQGRTKAFTLSYDDGVVQDKRLISLFDQYGAKGTFNLNSGSFGQRDQYSHLKVEHAKLMADEVARVYQNHEIACHTVTHPDLAPLPSNTVLYEVLEDRKRLEELSGQLVRGMAYPFGTFNEKVKRAIEAGGILFSRTVHSTHSFSIPDDFLEWDPTCHHDDPALMELAEKFLEDETSSQPKPKLFYVWGHAYEFDNNRNWEVMEKLLQKVCGQDGVWYATNSLIARYVMAARSLEYSADGMMIFNPTCQTVWMNILERDYVIPGGETVKVVRV